MGEFAVDVQERLRATLSEAHPEFRWKTEYRVGNTPVDLAGVGADRVVLVELEWRRADPADNTAKLFRHVTEGGIDADEVLVVQLFTRYYDLVNGGVSSKRKNAEFVGEVAADAFERLTYRGLEFDVEPPKRGGERPAEWQAATDEVAATLAELV